MKNIFILLSILLVMFSIKFGSSEANFHSTEMWNGGKQQGPVYLLNNNPRYVAGNSSTEMQVELTIPNDCRSLTAKVRGIDGLTVEHSDSIVEASYSEQTKQTLAVQVSLASNSGYLVIDLNYDIGSRKISETKSIQVINKFSFNQKPVEFSKDENGFAIQITKAVNP